MWISRHAFDALVEENRLNRALRAHTERLLQDARAENDALRKELAATRDAVDADRAALREAAVSLHQYVTASGEQSLAAARELAEQTRRQYEIDARERAQLEARVAVADVNFGWCRQLVNQLQATQAALLSQRGIIVPQVSFAGPTPSAPGPTAAGTGRPGVFEDEEALADAMGVSFEDVGDDRARAERLDHADVPLDQL